MARCPEAGNPGANGQAQRGHIALSTWLSSFLLAGITLLHGQPAAAACESDYGMLVIYQGTIGERTVRATFAFDGPQVNGQISAGPDYADISLRGTQRNGVLALHAAATDRPVLRGTLKGCSAISGTWLDPSTGQSFPLHLSEDSETGGNMAHRYDAAGAKDDRAVDAGVRAFQRAVVAHDARTASKLIAYPLRVNSGSKSRMIPNRAALLAQYDRIFTPAVRADVERAVPADLFSRDQGVMLGDGIVWFNENGKAISINQP